MWACLAFGQSPNKSWNMSCIIWKERQIKEEREKEGETVGFFPDESEKGGHTTCLFITTLYLSPQVQGASIWKKKCRAQTHDLPLLLFFFLLLYISTSGMGLWNFSICFIRSCDLGPLNKGVSYHRWVCGDNLRERVSIPTVYNFQGIFSLLLFSHFPFLYEVADDH